VTESAASQIHFSNESNW